MNQEIRRIVRIMSTDVDGNLSVGRALRKIKGVSFMYARNTCVEAGIDRRKKTGLLSESEIKNIERLIANPRLPSWMLNRRKDIETGHNMHVVMADLELKRRDDINLMKRMHSYKGVRHELGQPVRGQRTRSSFRTSKTVGVVKKKAMPAAAPKPAVAASKPAAAPAAKTAAPKAEAKK